MRSETIVVVGYGSQVPFPGYLFDGRRTVGTAPYLNLGPDHVTQKGSILGPGDSGGPWFIEEVQIALSVGRSLGVATGAQTGQRLDMPEVLEFLDQWC